MKSIKTKITAAVLLCALISVAICGGISMVNAAVTSYESSKREMGLTCEEESGQIDGMLQRVAQSVETVYGVAVENLKEPEKFKTSKAYVNAYTEKMQEILREAAVHTQGAMTAYIRYNPEFTEPTSGLFFTRESSDREFESITPTDFSMYDANDLEHVGWYYIPVQNKQATWMDPYLNSNLDVYMISYVIPIYVDGESIGIIGMDIDFTEFVKVLDQAVVFDHGYSLLASEQGAVMYHKDLEVGSQLEEADSGLAGISSALSQPDKEGTFLSYSYQGEKKELYYRTLTNGMRFVMTAPAAELEGQAVKLAKLIIGGSVLALIISVLIGLIISLGITRPISQINQIVISTSEFNFVHNPANEKLYKKKDETGAMAKSMHHMRSNLRKMIENITNTNHDMTHTMTQLTDTTNQVSEMGESNVAVTQELAAAMEETSATMETVNSTIGDIRQRAEIIQSRSGEGKQTALEIKARAGQLKKTTQTASEKTTRMYENVRRKTGEAMEQAKAVQKINELTQAILEISSQTNLLALNASIEAARAGEAGRGFAVVADEIGQLADQTSKTVGDINGIIDNVHLAVDNMTSCLQESTDFLEQNVLKDYQEFTGVAERYTEDADIFEDGMTEISGQIDTLQDAIADIAGAVDGVSRTVGETAQGITDIAQKTQEMFQIVQVNNDLVENSGKNISKLQEIVEMFHM